MNNRDLYRMAMSGVHHSEDAIERIFDMTVDKKKTNKALLLKRLGTAALALAIVAVGGFGTNAAIKNSRADKPLSVMVAYAGNNGDLSFGSKTDQKLFYGIYLAPNDNKELSEKARSRWMKDKAEILNELDNNAEGSSGSYGSGGFQCYSLKENKETAYCYTLEGGAFELDLEDYSDVKSFKVNNESEYGLLHFEYDQEDTQIYYDDAEVPDELSDTSYAEHEYTLTGDEIRYSQSTKSFEVGLGKFKENKGYFLTWYPSDELGYAIGDNLNFDLTQIKDTITFTIEYNDSTVKTASLNLYFDSDGYMHFTQ